MVFNLYVSGAIFGLGRVFKLFGPCGAPRRADFSARGCPNRTKLCTAQYFIIRNLRLSESFPPFGRRVAERNSPQIKSNVRHLHWCLTPHASSGRDEPRRAGEGAVLAVAV